MKVGNGTGETSLNVMADAVKFVYVPGADTQPPTVPTNLASGTISATSSQLTWTASTDNVGVAGYRVYRNGSFLTNAPSNSYLNSGLTANTTYSYEVSAYDAVPNESAKTSPLARTTLSTPPSAGSVTASTTTPCVDSTSPGRRSAVLEPAKSHTTATHGTRSPRTASRVPSPMVERDDQHDSRRWRAPGIFTYKDTTRPTSRMDHTTTP